MRNILEIEDFESSNYHIISLRGILGSVNVNKLTEKINEIGYYKKIIFDFSSLTLLDPSIYLVFYKIYLKLKSNNLSMCIFNQNDDIKKILNITGLNRYIKKLDEQDLNLLKQLDNYVL